MKGHTHRAATICIMREKALKRCEDPAYRAKLSEYAKRGWTLERRQAQMDAINAGHARKRAAKQAKPVDPAIKDRAMRNAAKAEAYLKGLGFK